MLVTSIFSFSHNVLCLYQNNFQVVGYIYFLVCKCFQFCVVQIFFKINIVTQFFNISASGLSQEKKRKFTFLFLRKAAGRNIEKLSDYIYFI